MMRMTCFVKQRQRFMQLQRKSYSCETGAEGLLDALFDLKPSDFE